MQTYTGKLVDLSNFTPEDVRLPDISHALSQINRFTGHTTHPLSVAEHSVMVSKLCPPEHALWGLLHDASEAYLGDVASPLKAMLPDYRAIEQRVQQVIARAFRLPWPMPDAVHEADRRALMAEKHALMSVDHDWGIDAAPVNMPVTCCTPMVAKKLFEARFKEVNP
jgi:hypothetical protein